MTPKTIVITGASSGIGLAAAEKLRKNGHRVILVGRDPEKTRRAAAELASPYYVADFSRLSEVRRLAEGLSGLDRIDVLCNNAGGALRDHALTEDGVEKTFQVNVLAAYLLTRLLMPLLTKSGATVIQTSSIAANLFANGSTDWQSEQSFDPLVAYGNAKRADIYLTRQFQRRFGEKGISAVAFEPGVVRTNFASESTPLLRLAYHSPLKYLFTISPQKSAARLVRLAEGLPGRDFVPGEVYSKREPMRLRFTDEGDRAAQSLWRECERLAPLSPETGKE